MIMGDFAWIPYETHDSAIVNNRDDFRGSLAPILFEAFPNWRETGRTNSYSAIDLRHHVVD